MISPTTKYVIFGSVAVILIVTGTVIFCILPDLINSKVKENFQLKPGTEAYEMWEEIPIPLLMEFYLFNVTNADDIVNFGAKPKLQQVGPYSYKETRKKIDIIHDDDGTISYKQIRTYFFDPETSTGSQDDIVTFPNVPLISATKIAEERNMESLLNSFKLKTAFPENIRLFVRRTVRELIFDGYYEPFIDDLQTLLPEKLLPDGMFALYYGKNGTDDGIYTVKDGIEDMSQFSKIVKYNNESTLSVWKENSTCNMINGTDGNQNPPFMKKDKLYVFMSELCRSVNLDYEKESEVAGISTYHYSLPFKNLLDPTLNPDNDCFCLNGLENCDVSGFLDVSKCNKGAPVFFGLPHYLLSDPMVQMQVDGLKPEKDKHLAFLDVEPVSGIPLQAARRIQVNVQMISRPIYSPLEISRMPDMMFPLLWVNEKVKIDEANAEKLKDMLITPVKIATVMKYLLIVIGVVLLLAVISVAIVRRNRTPSNQFHLKHHHNPKLNPSLSQKELIENN